MNETRQRDKTLDLYTCIASTVARLQADYLGQNGHQRQAAVRGILAELRKHAGKNPEEDPLSLESVLWTLDPKLPDNLLGRGDAPSPTERAAYLALSYFALHMQSSRTERHKPNQSFARACGLLYGKGQSESLKPRFDSILLAASPRARNTHIRSMITLLRGADIGFDYASFARDLQRLEYPKSRPGVLMRWGRDFATGAFQQHAEETTENN